jgi:hypothetical protein
MHQHLPFIGSQICFRDRCMTSHRSGTRKDLNPLVILFIYLRAGFCKHTITQLPLPDTCSLHVYYGIFYDCTTISTEAVYGSRCATISHRATHDMNSSLGAWSFTPLVTDFFALPNIAFWNVSNGTWEYQIQLAWPLNWSTLLENVTVETM